MIEFEQYGLETKILTIRTGESDDDISGVRRISDEIMQKLANAKKS